MHAIFHADREWGIGKENDLMFHLPRDMRFFRETTMGKVVVMGGNTLRSFPDRRPLRGRTNIVLTREQIPGETNLIPASDVDDLFRLLQRFSTDDVYVIGGAFLFKILIPYCSDVLVTKVDAVGGADVFAPDLDSDPNFYLDHAGRPIRDGGFSIRFCRYINLAVMEF